MTMRRFGRCSKCSARAGTLSASQLARFLERDIFAVETDLERLAAFFPEGGHLSDLSQVHHRLADGLAGQSRRYRVDVVAGHRRIADHLLGIWQSGGRDRFTLAHLPAHLAAADHPQALQDLLVEYRFLEAKLPAFGPSP